MTHSTKVVGWVRFKRKSGSILLDNQHPCSAWGIFTVQNNKLSVLDLSQIPLATEEDKACRLDHWASLFKAATWEEIKTLAQNDKYINVASETIYQLTQEKIRQQCEAREDYYRRQHSNEARMAKQIADNKELTVSVEKLCIIFLIVTAGYIFHPVLIFANFG